MKERASFTFDKKTIEIIEKLIQEKDYRNKSHVVEKAIRILGESELKENNGGKKK